MATDPIAAIKESRPPTTDPLTYLTIVESHLSPSILPTLNGILEDAELTQSIGWDLIQLLLPIPGSEECLTTIARLGNPREVVLKVTEALSLLSLDEDENEDQPEDDGTITTKVEQMKVSEPEKEPSDTDKFCTLLNLLAILHPRIKTKYPSRFLSSSLMAVLSAYRPSAQATHAVTTFIHSIAGQKRPMLPQRKSSAGSVHLMRTVSNTVAPDPEATDEDPNEKAIQKKLLQSFITHVLEEYVKENGLEWAARLQEHFEPSKVIPNRKSWGDSYRDDPDLQERDICVGQLVARARDLGLSGHSFLFESLEAISPPSDDDDDDEDPSPTSPEEIPLSKPGCLFLVTSFIFGSVMFDNKITIPPLTIFPDHTKLVKHFLGIEGPTTIGSEEEGIIDAILAIGLYLEDSSNFVSGPLADEDFLQELQTLSLLSANTPSPTLRYHAHLLCSSILHAHPVDRTRLTFINDTLEECPYENLKASAVGWLKEEFIMAHDRSADNIFSSPVALGSVQPYLFPDMTAIEEATEAEIWEEFQSTFPFHMAVLNFMVFVNGEGYKHVVPEGTLSVAEEIYVEPMRVAQERLEKALGPEGKVRKQLGEEEAAVALREVELLGERLATCLA